MSETRVPGPSFFSVYTAATLKQFHAKPKAPVRAQDPSRRRALGTRADPSVMCPSDHLPNFRLIFPSDTLTSAQVLSPFLSPPPTKQTLKT